MLVHYTSADQKTQEIWLDTLISASPYTILYFYPKDNTPGCSLEARSFTQLLPDFQKKHVQIIGVSRDSAASHCSFMVKQDLKIGLITDSELVLHRQFAARGEKKNYGKIYEGTIRSTFLLDSTGKILKERRNVKATGHAERVLKEIQDLI